MIARIQWMKDHTYNPYTCVVYSNSTEIEESFNFLPHGNTTSCEQPYVRTSKSVLDETDNLISQNKTNQEIYDTILQSSGGPFQSTTISNEPRNIKQIRNRRKAKSKKEVNQGKPKNNDLITKIIDAQSRIDFIHALVLEKQAYYVFLRTDDR